MKQTEQDAGERGVYYALLLSVGDYLDAGQRKLSTWEADLHLIRTGLCRGLHFEAENISVPGTEGFLQAKEAAARLADFSRMLKPEDSFLFWFSGHGDGNALCFSDSMISMQSIFDYIEKLPAKNRIVILDCCFSGRQRTGEARQMDFQKNIDAFAGHGIAVLASCASDEVSRLSADGSGSVYTAVLSSAMCSRRVVRRGRISLSALARETAERMKFRNHLLPERMRQHPIFRSSLGGTVYFPVETQKTEDSPKKIYADTDSYVICSVKPLSCAKMKRMAAFVIPKRDLRMDEAAAMTAEVAQVVRNAKILEEGRTRGRFADVPAGAVWCYFGKDADDIAGSLYFAYGIWAADEQTRQMYFKENRHACVIDDIYLWMNPSYEAVRKINEDPQDTAVFLEETKRLMAQIVSIGETFIQSLQEIENGEETIDSVKTEYKEQIADVRRAYLRLTDGGIPPAELQKWCDEAENVTGCILDLSLLLDETKAETFDRREKWMMHYAVERYYEGLEKMKEMEKALFS